MKIKVINKSKHQLPQYSTQASAGIILVNLSNENFVIKDGERICQMVIAKHEMAEWESVETLMESDRGSGGFGHTGKS